MIEITTTKFHNGQTWPRDYVFNLVSWIGAPLKVKVKTMKHPENCGNPSNYQPASKICQKTLNNRGQVKLEFVRNHISQVCHMGKSL